MSTNKNAQLRYQILDKCFSNRQRNYTIDDLVDAVNEKLYDISGSTVSLRQIRTDISFMRDSMGYDAPIVTIPYDGKKCYYRYSNPDFRIFQKEVSEEVMDAVRKTISLLNQYRGLPTNEWMEEIISSLEINLGIKPNVATLVSLEKNDLLVGLHYLADAIDYTISKQPLEITYHPYHGDSRVVLLHPYHVKQYNNRWYLWGYDEIRERISNLALDRIEHLKKSDAQFIENDKIDFTNYFDDVIGVTVPGEDVKIEHFLLKCSPHRFPYIVSKPMHHSQRVHPTIENCVSLDVRPNRELESMLFSYGPDVEILAPEWYRVDFLEKIKEIEKNYSSVKDGFTEIL